MQQESHQQIQIRERVLIEMYLKICYEIFQIGFYRKNEMILKQFALFLFITNCKKFLLKISIILRKKLIVHHNYILAKISISVNSRKFSLKIHFLIPENFFEKIHLSKIFDKYWQNRYWAIVFLMKYQISWFKQQIDLLCCFPYIWSRLFRKFFN